jgi:hypothetical protein
VPVRKPRRPSPAFILAAIALFASLGGTGYAATRLTSAPSHHAGAAKAKKAKALTKSQVNKLIASYVSAHKSEFTGARGPQGAAGTPGTPGTAGTPGTPGATGLTGHVGAQGPGAIPIVGTGSSSIPGAQPLATVGPWTLTLSCDTAAPFAFLKLTGPGTITSTNTVAAPGAAGITRENSGPIGSGATLAVNTDGYRVSETAFLQSGSTLYELKLFVAASNGGLFESCPVVGDAIPVS